MPKSTGDNVSVKIIPNEQGTPPGKLAEAEVIFEAEAGPLSGLKLIGFSIWETPRWREARDVPRPAVLRQRRTPELRAAASRQRRQQRTGPPSDMHPRRVQPRRSRLLKRPRHIPRRPGSLPAAWAPFVRF